MAPLAVSGLSLGSMVPLNVYYNERNALNNQKINELKYESDDINKILKKNYGTPYATIPPEDFELMPPASHGRLMHKGSTDGLNRLDRLILDEKQRLDEAADFMRNMKNPEGTMAAAQSVAHKEQQIQKYQLLKNRILDFVASGTKALEFKHQSIPKIRKITNTVLPLAALLSMGMAGHSYMNNQEKTAEDKPFYEEHPYATLGALIGIPLGIRYLANRSLDNTISRTLDAIKPQLDKIRTIKLRMLEPKRLKLKTLNLKTASLFDLLYKTANIEQMAPLLDDIAIAAIRIYNKENEDPHKTKIHFPEPEIPTPPQEPSPREGKYAEGIDDFQATNVSIKDSFTMPQGVDSKEKDNKKQQIGRIPPEKFAEDGLTLAATLGIKTSSITKLAPKPMVDPRAEEMSKAVSSQSQEIARANKRIEGAKLGSADPLMMVDPQVETVKNIKRSIETNADVGNGDGAQDIKGRLHLKNNKLITGIN